MATSSHKVNAFLLAEVGRLPCRRLWHGQPAGVPYFQQRLAAGPTAAERAEAELVAEMRSIPDRFDGINGSARMSVEPAKPGAAA